MWRCAERLVNAGCVAVLVVLGIGVGSACRRDAPPETPTMQFEVDPSRLGALVTDPTLGIQLQPPAGWEPLPETDLDSLVRVIRDPEHMGGLQPKHVFLHPSNGSLGSVSILKRIDSLDFDAQIDQYRAHLAARFPDDSLRQGRYVKDGIDITQFLQQPRGHIAFKLLFESPIGEILQVDYIVPRAFYPEQIRAIESSIGSIQWLE